MGTIRITTYSLQNCQIGHHHVELSEPTPQALGTHCLLDLFGCPSDLLDDPEWLTQLLAQSATMAGATVLSAHHHRFEPHGVSALCVLSESHISIHTWPEFGTASADVYTCGDSCTPQVACAWMIEQLRPEGHDLRVVDRGARTRPLVSAHR